MRTFVLDLGNTQFKYGLFDGSALREHGTAETPAQLRDLLQSAAPAHAIAASVVADAEAWLAELRAQVPGRVVVFEPGTTPVPLRNLYATPHTLGADRLAAAVGAAALRPNRDVAVVDAGTALKIDLVTADGAYRGGSIAPGLRLRLRALHEFTGRLPQLELPDAAALPVQLTGTSTASAMLSGVLNGATAEVAGVLAKYRRRYPGLDVVLAGGDVPYLRPGLVAHGPQTAGRIFAVPEVVLLGLYQILRYNVER